MEIMKDGHRDAFLRTRAGFAGEFISGNTVFFLTKIHAIITVFRAFCRLNPIIMKKNASVYRNILCFACPEGLKSQCPALDFCREIM